MTNNVELFFGSIPLTSKAQKFEEEGSLGRVSRIGSYCINYLLDSFLKFCSFEKLFSLGHVFVPRFPRRRSSKLVSNILRSVQVTEQRSLERIVSTRWS